MKTLNVSGAIEVPYRDEEVAAVSRGDQKHPGDHAGLDKARAIEQNTNNRYV